MNIRKFQDSDYGPLFQLFQQQEQSLAFHHSVSAAQFRSDLFTTRYIRDPADHQADAEIGLVATRNDRLVAFVNGGLITQGDEVVESGTGYISSVIADADAGNVVLKLLKEVTQYLKRFTPNKILAHDGCLCPTFFADSAGSLPSTWARIGQWLIDAGFAVNKTMVRLVLELDAPRPDVQPPGELQFLHIKHEMKCIDPQYDFGCLLMKPPFEYGDGVVWSGNFYSGAYTQGSGFDSIYLNYFTIMDDQYRGKGLGRLVLQHCLHEAQKQGATFASLLTDADNFVARSLYHSEGFRVVDSMLSFEFGDA